jgi:ABC-2 type transport system ATP-binding protein
MTSDVAIAAHRLVKHYGAHRAVSLIDLHVRRGEIYALIGRNGAGKTTTIRMLLGLVRPTSGEVMIFGRRVGTENPQVLARVGNVVESAAAYPNLTVRENLSIQRRLTLLRQAGGLKLPVGKVGSFQELRRNGGRKLAPAIRA